MKLQLITATVGALALGGAAGAGVPHSLQGSYARHFGIQDFTQTEEAPSGSYAMTITRTELVWRARGLGWPIEQIKVAGVLLMVRDKPGSLGRLCATNAWGSYRFKVDATRVVFKKVKDPCVTRGDILGKTWSKKH